MKNSLHTFKRTSSQLAVIACFALTAPAALAGPTVFNDTYTLQTTNQSMWSAGGVASWNYNSGFQGATWGAYAGDAPTSFGVNAISGSQNALIFPAIPGTPGFHVPSTRTCVWGVCTPELGDYDVPGIPGTPEVRGDTRTGAAVTMNSSGRVGVAVNASANGGAISVTLPVATQMVVGETVNGKFHISGSNAVGAGASMSATAPSFKAGVDGIINLDSSISASACSIGPGCTTTSANFGINPGQFSLVALDTTAAKPLSALGYDISKVELGKDVEIRATDNDNSPVVATVKLSNLVDHTGGQLAGGTLSMSNNQTVLNVAADLTGIAENALGIEKDVLNPSVNLGVASASGTLLDVRAGVNLGLTQSFDFNPDLLATLTFDRPVVQYERQIVDETVMEYFDINCFFGVNAGYECDGNNRVERTPVYGMVKVNKGYQVTIDLTAGADLEFADGGFGDLIGRSYSIADATNFSSDSSLSIDPSLPIKAGCMDLSLAGGLGSTSACALDTEFHTTGLLDVSVFSNDFALGGFNQVGFESDLRVGVPEPSSYLLMAIGLAGLGFAVRRRTRALVRQA